MSYTVAPAPEVVRRKIESALKKGAAQPEVIFCHVGSYEGPMLFWAQAGDILSFLEQHPSVGLVASWITTESEKNLPAEAIADLDSTLMRYSSRINDLVTRQHVELEDLRRIIRYSKSSFVIICLPPM